MNNTSLQSKESAVEEPLEVINNFVNELDDLKLHFYIAVGVFSGAFLVIFCCLIFLFVKVKKIRSDEKPESPEFRISRVRVHPENPYRRFQVPDESRMSGRNPLSNANNIVNNTDVHSPQYVNELKNSRNFAGGRMTRDPYAPAGSDYFSKINERNKIAYY